MLDDSIFVDGDKRRDWWFPMTMVVGVGIFKNKQKQKLLYLSLLDPRDKAALP